MGEVTIDASVVKQKDDTEDLFNIKYSTVRDGTVEEIRLELRRRGLENRHAHLNNQRVCMCKCCDSLLVTNGINFASYGGEEEEMNFGVCVDCRKAGKG